MGTPRENQKRVSDLVASVKDHPMCFRLSMDPTRATVFFPAGDFPVQGATTTLAGGKANGLTRLLNAMERIWMESYPAAHTGD